MHNDLPLQLLSGLTARQFMRRHWQKKPLLVRGAIPAFRAPVDRASLFALAARDEVESRLIERDGTNWRLSHGPFARRALPALKKPGWTLLVQGVDARDDAAHALLQQFRFVPDARLDDLMISYASDGGGVGPHFDRYDVFLLQAHGRRRWRIGRQRDLELAPGLPLKVLADFRPEQEFVLEAGDMLYLPPRWAHDGDAIDECMTWSIGFRAPEKRELARDMLQRVAESLEGNGGPDRLYADPGQAATDSPAAIPPALSDFGRDAIRAALRDPAHVDRALGEILSEPKPSIWFEPACRVGPVEGPLRLDRRTRMLYDERHVFVNGESLSASGRDLRLMRQLADNRALTTAQVAGCSSSARAQLGEWLDAGWVQAGQPNQTKEST